MAGLAGAPADAAEHDAQIWLTGEARFSLDEKWTLKTQANGRFTNFADRLGQTRIAAQLSRDVGGGVSLGAGYGHVITRNANMPDRHENRFWQSINWEIVKTQTYSVAMRTQLEQRLISGDAGWRARQRLSLKRTLNDKLYVYGSGEGYVFLNDTRWGAQSGFEQLRLGGGVGFDVQPGVVVEIGYLNRLKIVDAAEDRMSHIIGVTLKLRP